MNKIFLTGNISKDIEVKATSTTSIANLTVNCSKKTKEGWVNNYIECVAFGKVAEIIAEHFKSGSAIELSGELTQESWDDKQTGRKRYKHVVRVDSFDFPRKDMEFKSERGVTDKAPNYSGRTAPASKVDDDEDAPF